MKLVSVPKQHIQTECEPPHFNLTSW